MVFPSVFQGSLIVTPSLMSMFLSSTPSLYMQCIFSFFFSPLFLWVVFAGWQIMTEEGRPWKGKYLKLERACTQIKKWVLGETMEERLNRSKKVRLMKIMIITALVWLAQLKLHSFVPESKLLQDLPFWDSLSYISLSIYVWIHPLLGSSFLWSWFWCVLLLVFLMEPKILDIGSWFEGLKGHIIVKRR